MLAPATYLAPMSSTVSAPHRRHAWHRPLFWKMLGADALLVGFTAVVFPGSSGERLVLMILALLVASLVLDLVLTPAAMRPLHAAERAARRLAVGTTMKPPASGEHSIEEVLEQLVAHIEADRTHNIDLVRRTLRVHEEQRAAIARQLRDTTGQDLAALNLQLTAAIRGNRDPKVAAVLDAVQATTARLMDDVRAAADEIYPGLLSEFGLLSALSALRRRIADRSRLDVRVRVEGSAFTIPLPVMRALLRVAEEAVENTEQHASVNAVNVTLRFDAPTVMIEVVDEGVGFDVAAAERRSTGVGLFRARELLAHAGGAMHIRSSPGSGTRVVATSTVAEGSDT